MLVDAQHEVQEALPQEGPLALQAQEGRRRLRDVLDHQRCFDIHTAMYAIFVQDGITMATTHGLGQEGFR